MLLEYLNSSLSSQILANLSFTNANNEIFQFCIKYKRLIINLKQRYLAKTSVFLEKLANQAINVFFWICNK